MKRSKRAAGKGSADAPALSTRSGSRARCRLTSLVLLLQVFRHRGVNNAFGYFIGNVALVSPPQSTAGAAQCVLCVCRDMALLLLPCNLQTELLACVLVAGLQRGLVEVQAQQAPCGAQRAGRGLPGAVPASTLF